MQNLFLKQNWRRRIAVLFLASFLVMTVPAPAAKAGVWGEGFASNFMQTAIEKVLQFIEDMLKGIAKSMAVQMAVRTANKVTGDGHKNGPSFITDYKQYIYSIALDESLVFANDFMTQTLGAKYSGLVYIAATGNLQSLGRSYMSYLAGEAKNALNESNYCKYTLDQYTNNPLTSLQAGDWKVFNALVANPCNNPTGYTYQVKKAFQEDLQRRADLARTRAIASQGFTGTEKNGKIVAPGSIIRDITAKAHTTALDLIPNATGWGEILSAAAGAFVNQVMTNMIQRGFESVAKKVDRELGKVDKKVLEARQEIEGQLGPGGYFLRNNIQQIGNAAAQNVRFGNSTEQAKVQFNGVPGVCGTGDSAC